MTNEFNKNPDTKSRYWVFTINNYTDSDISKLDTMCNDVRYLTYGREVGKEKGTPHLQGYLEFPTGKSHRFKWVKDRLPRAYIAIRKGSRTQARDYCFKECDQPFEYGEWVPDRQGMRNDLVAMKRKLDEGMDMFDVAGEHFGSYLRYHRGMEKYQQMAKKRKRKICQDFKAIWIYGPSRSGKTSYVYEKYGMEFYEKPNNKWWDAYENEEIVLWDDYERSSDYTYGDLLKWTDRYPKTGESKGGHKHLYYHTIIFTSTHHPRDLGWIDEQFLKRCDLVNITQVTSSRSEI